jgi:alpha-methylacyl-CoA racemase
MPGPLEGIRILELAAIGPGPFAGMMLADHGADVIRIDRPGGTMGGVGIEREKDVLGRSRRSIIIDLKQDAGIAAARRIAATCDGLIEGFRPGVMERLGLGPEVLLSDNPRLVYGRITGWGQSGPLAQSAGHDLNYIALSGALHSFGRKDAPPTPPLNLVGDFGGGGLLLAFGMLAALHHAKRTGEGQVVDAAMCEGSSLLMAMIWGLYGQGSWINARGSNDLDTAAHFYECYLTADRLWIAIAPIEPGFYRQLLERLGLQYDPLMARQNDQAAWPEQKRQLESVFRTRTRDEWCVLLEGSDCCFAPVLSLDEAPLHPHNVARRSFVTRGEMLQPAPAPRYSATGSRDPEMPGPAGREGADLLAEAGYGRQEIAALVSSGVVTAS